MARKRSRGKRRNSRMAVSSRKHRKIIGDRM